MSGEESADIVLTCVMKDANACVEKMQSEKMMRSITYDNFENLYKKYKGYIGTNELLEEGFSNRQIAALTEENYLEKVCHGYYWLAKSRNRKPSDYKCIEVCLSDPNAVVCMDSACYYQGVHEIETRCLSVATERTDRSRIKMEHTFLVEITSSAIAKEQQLHRVLTL